MKLKPTSDLRTRVRLAVRCLALVSACALTPLAHADIYGYVDSSGDTHFSTEKLDARYQLFIKGDRSFDSSELTAPVPTPLHPALFKVLTQHPNLKKYEALLVAAAKEFKVDVALMKAMMAAESGFNPTAVSPKGAIGLMQIMPATAERYGVTGDSRVTIQQKLTDPRTNMRLAARYLHELNQMFPNQQPLVIASYNAGEGAVQKYRNQIPPYAETRNYVQLVTQFYQLYGAQNAAPNKVPSVLPGERKASHNASARSAANATATAPSNTATNATTGSSETTATNAAGTTPRRIHLTIPGRANLPQSLANNASTATTAN